MTRAIISLKNITHNMRFLQGLVGTAELRPAIKANAYGHGAEIFARHLISIGYRNLCVAHVCEAEELIKAGVEARFTIFSPDLGDAAKEIIHFDLEPAVCTEQQLSMLSRTAEKVGVRIRIHMKIDTGMGRVGFPPAQFPDILIKALDLPGVEVIGIMSHFPRADESNETYSREQIVLFKTIMEKGKEKGRFLYHIANSACIFHYPEAHFDVCRPGIAIYGLSPFSKAVDLRVGELRPVLSLKSNITQLKEIPAGTGLSYGHRFVTQRQSLIATVPVGYGDGLFRTLSNRYQFLIRGTRCPQVGMICMDQCLVDVTSVRGIVETGDEVVIIGGQGKEYISVDEIAKAAGTINYEVVTRISKRVLRLWE